MKTSALLIIGLTLGGVINTLCQYRPLTYKVVVAGASEGATYRSLVTAIDEAHDLFHCPETEQEKGRPILVLDSAGRLIDTICDN